MYKLGESSGPWRYAGRHGWVTEEEFHKLGQSNQLKIGAGPWNNAIQGLQRDALALYKQLPDEWEENIERTAGQVAENVGNAYNSLPEVVKEQVQKVKTGFIDIPAQAIQNLSDLDGHIAAGHRYGGLHPGPLEFGLEAAHTALTSGGSQVSRLKHIEDLAQITNKLSINPKYFANPLPDKPRIKKVVEIGKDVATKPAAKAISRTNGNGKLKNGHTNGNGNGTKNGNPSTKVSKTDQDILERSVDVVNKELIEIEKQLAALGPRNKKNTAKIKELNKSKSEYERHVSSLQTLLLTGSKNDLQLLTALDKALSLNFKESADAIVHADLLHYGRAADALRILPDAKIHHKNWLRLSASPFARGKVPTSVRNDTLHQMADQGVLYSNVNPNLEGLIGDDVHRIYGHGNTFESSKSRLPGILEVRKRLMTLGANASAKDIVKELSKLNEITEAATIKAISSPEHSQRAYKALDELVLPPGYDRLSVDPRSVHNQSLKDAVQASGDLQRQIEKTYR